MQDNEPGAAIAVHRILDEVIAAHANQVGTHYGSCYVRHAGCLAVRPRDELGPRPDTGTDPMCVDIAARLSGNNDVMVG